MRQVGFVFRASCRLPPGRAQRPVLLRHLGRIASEWIQTVLTLHLLAVLPLKVLNFLCLFPFWKMGTIITIVPTS